MQGCKDAWMHGCKVRDRSIPAVRSGLSLPFDCDWLGLPEVQDRCLQASSGR